MESGRPRFGRSRGSRNADSEQATTEAYDGRDRIRNRDNNEPFVPVSEDGVRTSSPTCEVPGTASSRWSSLSRSTLTLARATTSGKERNDIINEYYDETGVVAVIESWIKQLVDKKELPYNPYVDLVWQARQCAERFHLFEEENTSVLEKIENQVFSVGSYISRTQDSPAHWGLSAILHVVNTEFLSQFDYLLSSMNSDVSTEDSEDYLVSLKQYVTWNLLPGLDKRFHLFEEENTSVLEKIENQVFSVGSYISRTQDSPAHWGLSAILHVVNTEFLSQFDYLLSSMNSDVSTEDSEDYLFILQKPLPVLIGPCVFGGGLYPVKNTEDIEIRMEYAISGPGIDQASEIFATAVIRDLQLMIEADTHILLGFTIPVEDVRNRGRWIDEFWTNQNIDEVKDQFLMLLKSATSAQKIASAQCMFRMQPEKQVFRRGCKQYNLNFTKTEGERSRPMSVCPYQSAHEGVFSTRSNIKEYLSWFASLDECMFRMQPEKQVFRRGCKQYNLNFTKTEGERSRPMSVCPYQSAHEGVFSTRSNIKEYLSWFASLDEAHEQQSLVTPATNTRTGSHDTGRSRRNRSRNTSNLQPQSSAVTRVTSQAASRVTSEGDDSQPAMGPYGDEPMGAMKTYLSGKILDLADETDFFRMLHYVILLTLLNREDGESQDCLVEAYRLMRSTAYQLHLVMQQNHVLQDLVTFFTSCGMGASDILQTHFMTYRHSLKDFFCNSLKEKSKDFLYCGNKLLNMLDAMTVINPHLDGKTSTGSLPLSVEVSRGLEVINRYCETIFLGLIDIALSCCSSLMKYFPPVKKKNSLMVQHSFGHGVEKADIITQDKLLLSVDEQAKTVAAPAVIAKETVLMQYIADSKLDQVFHEFLVDLVTDEECIPPNPYPRLTSELSVAALKMELFGEKPAKLLSKLVTTSVQPIDADNLVHHIPGIEAYGTVSAVAALDGRHYNTLRSTLHSLANKVSTRMTVAGFSTVVDLAVCGFSPIYGRMMPYLHDVDLEEHYFVQGPSHRKAEAIQHFAKLVYEHLVDFSEKEDVLFLGFYLGGETLRRSLHDIVPPQRKKTFLLQLISSVKSKQSLYLRVYVAFDWRLVMVKKTFCLHLLHGQEQGYERFYNSSSNPLAFYQIVFSRQDAALLYTRCCGPQDRTDPCKGENLVLSLVHVDHYIERAKEEDDLLAVYRWLMVKSLISKHKSYLLEAWRMFHSVAFQLEYLCTVNRTLQSLVNEEVSRAFRPVLDDDERTSLLDASALSSMVTAYCDKLERVLSRRTAFTPNGFLPRLRDKIRLVTSTNPVSRTLNLLISSKTPVILQEINELLQPLVDAAAHNVHLACPEIHRALKSVEVDVTGRNSRMLTEQK
ncbi:uncharacterized protein LOC111339076 [Stylophora pistillata]|uniref:uncharacterized protein LOC111339076 n=1 Tax=Stylophora pistillata TaxID=50429 RepID=UPI000C03961B|nr:uncharacterized protein LOC111339076 [Stylophora pistillata]